MRKDFVFIKNLAIRLCAGRDSWKRQIAQPTLVSVAVNANVSEAASLDQLGKSINYDDLSRDIVSKLELHRYDSIASAAEEVANRALSFCSDGQWTRVCLVQPSALLRADSCEICIQRFAGRPPSDLDSFRISNLQIVTIIGVNNVERMHLQPVSIDITIRTRPKELIANAADIVQLAEKVTKYAEATKFWTVEALTEGIARFIQTIHKFNVTVRCGKPKALALAELAGAEVSLDGAAHVSGRAQESCHKLDCGLDTVAPQLPDLLATTPRETVYIAFGANMDNPIDTFRRACSSLNLGGIHVKNLSPIYRSYPMYYKDQDFFYNAVAACETKLNPQSLLRELKKIELNDFGRNTAISKGPRVLDLDILLYGKTILNDTDLQIPHQDMLNRTFVLRPLLDIAPDVTHPVTTEPIAYHLRALPSSNEHQISSVVTQVIPAVRNGKLVPLLNVDPVSHTLPTLIMAVVNVTPDSFSDGHVDSLDTVVARSLDHIKAGAHILDIGGLSTRPGHKECGVEEECRRVVTALRAIRAHPDLATTPISVDTYRHEVALAALDHGADMLNVVFAGSLDPEIFDVAARNKCPIILSHGRGRPDTMDSLAIYEGAASVVTDVGAELLKAVRLAEAAGVMRFQIILDPGLGFAKSLIHNLELVRNFKFLKRQPGLDSFPWLVGPSRKRFVGSITGELKPKQRVIGTAVAATSLIEQGADIIRVHDTKALTQAAKMADALYRNIR